MSFAFMPMYAHALGMEAFGLVGLMLSLQAISQLFDFGAGGVVNRELSRRAHQSPGFSSSPDLVRTFEWLLWPMTFAIASLIWASSGVMSEHWLHLEKISYEESAHAISIMGIAIALLWPSTFYANCLSGLERQPILNLINATFATLKSAGVLVVMHFFSPTINTFLWWYAALSASQSAATAAAVWHALPRTTRAPIFVFSDLRDNGRFAIGLFTIGALALALTQIDRLSLATSRPLAELGYYTLALSVAAGLGRMIQPMFNALYPRFSRLVATHDEAALSELYHLGNQCIAVIVASTSSILMIFARDVLFLWTGDNALAGKIAPTLVILTAGTALNGFMNLPYALQLAYGWTSIAMYTNLASFILGVPFCIWAVSIYGMPGAACLWLLINLGYFTFGIPLMHQRLLRNEARTWYFRDILPPVLTATLVSMSFGAVLVPLSRTLWGFLTLVIVSAVTLLLTAASSQSLRTLGYQRMMRRFAN